MKIILSLFLLVPNFVIGQVVTPLLDDDLVGLLLGKSLVITICEAKSATLEADLETVAIGGLVPFGRESGYLLKNIIILHDILYVSPSILIDSDAETESHLDKSSFELKELWTEVKHLGGELELHIPFQDSKKYIVVAEPMVLDGKTIFIVRKIRPIGDKGIINDKIIIRKNYDKIMFDYFKKLVESK